MKTDYYKYHRLIGHPIEKCFMFKKKVMDLARQGVILHEEDKVSANQVTTTLVIFKPVELKISKDFWESKLEPVKQWRDYSSHSDGEDSECPATCAWKWTIPRA
ncbi:hypothetical protein LIER_05862 [Lithospermum erythrorhizon]|uniref:Uncharacterized protein n=1 Tax=Lithospermum erythrorhizon TaxID=34254 RepID=A0AAV3P3D9_LITER